MSDAPGCAIEEPAHATRRRWQPWALALYVGVIAASVGKVAGGNALGFFVAGLAMAGIALGLLSWLRGADVGRTASYDPLQLLGLRIGMWGLGLASLGWVVAAWLQPTTGALVALLGVIAGVVGVLWVWGSVVAKRVGGGEQHTRVASDTEGEPEG